MTIFRKNNLFYSKTARNVFALLDICWTSGDIMALFQSGMPAAAAAAEKEKFT
jgi:hypothetical protein